MKLYFKYMGLHLKSQMQYPLSFFLMVLANFLISFTWFIGIYVLFLRFPQVEGFTFPQVLLCFSVVLMAFSLAESFGRGFDVFPQMIANGQFDRALVRPRGLIFQVLASQLEWTRLSRLLQAALVLAYALPRTGILWAPDRVLTLLLMVACGAVVFFCLFVIYAAISFFTLEGLEFMNILTDGGREFGRFPFSIYGREILAFFTYIVPLALFQYYPLLYLLGREQGLFYRFAPLFSLCLLLPTRLLWRLGLRHYKSTGS